MKTNRCSRCRPASRLSLLADLQRLAAKERMKLYAYRVPPKANYNRECISCTHPKDDDNLIAFTDHFKVILHPNQSSIGSVIIASRRHVARICDFTHEESSEFLPLFAALEPALESAFGAELLNLFYQRNWAYRKKNPDPPFKDGKPNPHVHCHVVPRYLEPVEFEGMRWEDPNFGEPFSWGKVNLNPEIKRSVISVIQNQLDLNYDN